MPDRTGPTDPWERSIKDIRQGKISPPKYRNVLELPCTPAGTCSPAQPSPGRKLGTVVGACLFPEPGHSRGVCLADQGSLESGFQRHDIPRLWGPLHS